MKACFIGNRFGVPYHLLPELKKVITALIEEGCTCFYCGTYGKFDDQVLDILDSLRKQYNLSIIKVKPYYQPNIFISKREEKYYKEQKTEIEEEYKFDGDKERYQMKLHSLKINTFYKNWYLTEQNYFTSVIIPDGIEKAHPKYRIIECNKWKVRHSDVLICYSPNRNGNSYKIRTYAAERKKRIIDIR